jgi:hypothetical protein
VRSPECHIRSQGISLKGQKMKRGLALALVLLCGGSLAAAAGSNDEPLVTWRNIVGVITAPGIDNPVAVTSDQTGRVLSEIHSGTLPWVTRSGFARVDLTTGEVQFNVSGLVLIGGNASGTAGPINQVTGTLVCNPGSTDPNQLQAVVDTAPVALSTLGNARFSGELSTAVPSPCTNPLFLIRIGPAFGPFAGRWLASGVEPRLEDSHGSRHDRRDEYDRR